VVKERRQKRIVTGHAWATPRKFVVVHFSIACGQRSHCDARIERCDAGPHARCHVKIYNLQRAVIYEDCLCSNTQSWTSERATAKTWRPGFEFQCGRADCPVCNQRSRRSLVLCCASWLRRRHSTRQSTCSVADTCVLATGVICGGHPCSPTT
jgi:hypothetical protein